MQRVFSYDQSLWLLFASVPKGQAAVSHLLTESRFNVKLKVGLTHHGARVLKVHNDPSRSRFG